MAIGYLNERTQKMITMILKSSNVLSIKEIALELGVSTRTIYNEMDKANSWLKMNKLPQIQILRGRVQLFTGAERMLIGDMLESEEQRDDYIFTPEERIRMIICQIIISPKAVYVEDLMNTCLVSRNTIFTDLQAVTSQLHTYQLDIGYEKRTGYFLEGDPIRVRAIFFLYFNMLEQLFIGGKLNFLHMEKIKPYLESIEQFEETLNVKYVRNDKIALAAMIPVMERGKEQLDFSNVDVQKVKTSTEYQFVVEQFPQLSDSEKVYLTLHFLGGRLEVYSKKESLEDIDETIWEISKNLVSEFERRACVIFKRRKELIANVYTHVKSSIYRYKLGIQIGNPMAEDIKREYPYIFDVMRASVQYLEQQIGVQISDNEVSYLALHFGAQLEFAEEDEKELRILVVCMNGMATGNMISHELSRILPQARIVGVQAASKLMNPQSICDLIVSSVKIEAVVPVIVVNPILNDFDRNNILNHPLVRNKFGFVNIEALFRVVKKYVPDERHTELKHDLERFFLHGREEKQPVLNREVWRLTDFLTDDRIVFLNGNMDWREAVQIVSNPLLKRGSMGKSYVQNMIDRLEEAGPYMFITRDLILLHARPEYEVKHLDLSIGLAPDGIPFGNGKTARILFCIAVEDQQKHLGILRDIRKTLAKKEQVDELMTKTDAEAVCEKIRSGILG